LPNEFHIAVVIPAYKVAAQIQGVIAAVPRDVRHVLVVDDASPDDLRDVLKKVNDPRLVVLRHDANRGVGAAMKTGFAKALELGADVVVKIDGDGQMDPRLIADFVRPLLEGRADLTKGNRFSDLAFIRKMPFVRRFGNLALSFLVKLASGYWHVFDPCNGYVAVRAEVLKRMLFRRLADRYFFEISFLCEAYFARAVLEDVPMTPVYAEEASSLKPSRIVFEFSPKLVVRTIRRILASYFLYDFNVVSLMLVAGFPLFVFGVVWSGYHWILVLQTGVLATTGTVVIGALSIILGFQLLLEGLVLDVQNEPGRARR